MPSRSRTPYRPDAEPKSEGLVIQVGTPNAGAEEAQAMARRVVDTVLRGLWEIEPLGISARDFAVVKPEGARQLTVQRSWELAAQLQEHRDVVFAEPALVVPGIAPQPEQVYTEEERRSIADALGADPLPCSQDPTWSLSLSKIQEAWSLPLPDHGHGKPFAEGIVVGHPDTGYTEHPEIWEPSRLLVDEGYDFERNDSDPAG